MQRSWSRSLVALVLAAVALVAASAVAAREARAQGAPPPWASRHALDSAAYEREVEALSAIGYRPVAVDAHGSANDAEFVGIWVKDGKPWAARHGVDSDGYQQAVSAFSAQGKRVQSVATYGTWPDERYVATFVKDGLPWVARHRLTTSAYQREFDEWTGKGYRPAWVSANGPLGSVRFAAVFVKDGKGFAAVHARTGDELADRMKSYAGGGLRLVCLAEYGTPGLYRYAAIWVEGDARAGDGMVFLDQTASRYQTTTQNLWLYGYRPVCAVRSGSGSSRRYSSCWVLDPGRTFRARGTAVPELAALDDAVRSYMQDRRVTGGALAVWKGGRLVLSRGYSNGPATMQDVLPSSRFRLASISKPLTAIAILRLVDQGKLELDRTLGEIFPELWLPWPAGARDLRFCQVTVDDLLKHRGGWDKDELGFDPQFRDRSIASALYLTNEALPISAQDVISYMSRFYRLQFDPGTDASYSNFGFNILGRVIERVTGEGYEAYLKREVFDRVGAPSFAVGRSEIHGRLAGEVPYHDVASKVSADVMGTDEAVPNPYGGWNIANMDAHGGWISDAADLVRVAAAARNGSLLSPATRAYYRDELGYPNHNGSLPGTSTELRVRQSGDVIYAALFNQRAISASDDPSGRYAWSRTGKAITTRNDDALASITTWP